MTATPTQRYLLIIALLGSVLILAANIIRIGSDGLSGVSPADFPNYYFGGKRWFEGRPIYAPLDSEVRESLGWEYSVYPADPPIAVILLAPLALLPYSAAWWSFLLLSIALIIGSTFYAARWSRLPATESALIAMFAVLSIPSLFLLKRNHMESLLLPLSIGGWILFQRRKESAAMALWGIAAALKFFPALWILGAWRVGRRGAVIQGIGWAIGATALGCALAGASNTESFLTETIFRSKQWYGAVGNLSLLSFGTALQGAWLGILFESLGILAFLESCFARGKMDSARWFCVTGWSILLSPLGWVNYWILLAAPLVLLLYRNGERRDRIAALSWGLVLLYWPTSIETPSAALSILLSHVPTIGLLGLLFLIRRNERRAAT